MKKTGMFITGFVMAAFGIAGCDGAQGNDPGDAYMPDMYYSRAYEAYGYNTTDQYYKNLAERGIKFNGLPVSGTMARGDAPGYTIPNSDSGYALSAAYKRATSSGATTAAQRKEAERLYLVNCAICHGTALDGNGPLWKGGDGPYPAAPRNLKDDYSKKLPDGQMYHVITYGKGQMGSYASQVKPEERWWIIEYIREKQGTGGVAQSNNDSTKVGGVPAGGAAGGAGTINNTNKAAGAADGTAAPATKSN